MVEARQVRKNFGRLEVLKGIDLEVPAGTVTCLIGPSGSGKSTLLRCVNHLEKVDAGRLYVDGELIGYRERDGVLHEISQKDAAKQRADIGLVFQSFNLF
ncbi:MAG: amino acid ABC transporter ATP-binding protein, partial [Microbacteriaceae bacterium]|nr:amino acid ABC transporter ATP-binding protein [Microbacteriaceae bacterium]